MKKYLIRLDDACPTMDVEKWTRIETILDKYGVLPMVGVIPHCEDPTFNKYPFDSNFWSYGGTFSRWISKGGGWTIAMHGYNHCFNTDAGLTGLNPIWKRSEFAGVPLTEQREKIRKGVEIMRAAGVNPKYFFAPAHTFDSNTLKALLIESDIRVISDTIANRPYKNRAFTFVPQFGGGCKSMPFGGVYTFCLHPNNMKEADFLSVEKFFQKNRDLFVSFDELELESISRGKNYISRLLSIAYFSMRRIRGLK